MSATVKRGRALINAQALIGTVLGNCTIQKLMGQGSMGAVFQAQQTHPQRQVAVKVLAPATVQTPGQRTQFLERFRQEIKAISSLEHQHIVSIYEYGEHEGLPYLVMPYIDGGTLLTILERPQPLALPTIASYLHQLASALDYAHENGSIHRDVRPANVLRTTQGQLLLTDFGLVKIAIERHTSQMRLLKSDTPIGSLEYMAPEQVMGDVIDARTDLYSLGIVLYQMVTGRTPFVGGTPIQIATQLVQTSPPPPCQFRPDLPAAAEQVILQALAKRSQDRYARCQDFANAFRAALTPVDLVQEQGNAPTNTHAAAEQGNGSSIAKTRKRSLFDPVWQNTPQTPAELSTNYSQNNGQATPTMPPATTSSPPTQSPSPTRMRIGLRASLLRSAAETPTAPTTPVVPASTTPIAPATSTSGIADQPFPHQFGNVTRTLPAPNSESGTTDAFRVPNPVSPFPSSNTTGALMIPGTEQGTVKLTGTMKVVQVPVAGQPGRYVTGLLPVLPQTQLPPSASPPPETPSQKPPQSRLAPISKLTQRQKILALALAIALILFIPGILLFTHPRSSQMDKGSPQGEVFTPDWSTIQASQATATANANYILTDPLTQNIHNWPIADSGYQVYKFENGAYHVLDNNANQSAPAILPGVILSSPMVYTLTMEEVKGNDGSVNNSFGMIFRFTSQPQQGSQNAITFYSFEVVNTHGGEYQFWKYDNSKGKSAHPWTSIWRKAFGGEFREGQGGKNANTFQVTANGKNFAFMVNSKKVGTAQDASLTSGEIGMLVNLKGTEVAFSNLVLTYS
jgi:serine/threonine protein kinase